MRQPSVTLGRTVMWSHDLLFFVSRVSFDCGTDFVLLLIVAVLTKVIVYAGISVIATEIMPFVFDLLGWGVRSWPPTISS